VAPEGPSARRLFFALWPDPVLKAAIAGAARNPARGVSGRRVRDENLHLTVLFLGALAADAEARLAQAAAGVRVAPFELVLDRVGCFFRAGVLWVGPGRVPPALFELRGQLEGVARGAGVAFDPKPLVPHVTCYRDLKKGTHTFSKAGSPPGKGVRPLFEPLRWPVRDFALVHSAGGQYHVVSQWPLQNASASNVKTVQAPGGTE
jgi:2'-5' RNA ligase